ncbi:MAG: S16 family serine protease [Candidatus Woesearchaeota archaeon]
MGGSYNNSRFSFKKTIIYSFVILLLLFSCVEYSEGFLGERSGHIKLLAVQQAGDDYSGSIADLYLEISQGSGRVFIDTFPLSKVDTQISTRFAKETVCNFLDMDCSNYDFFYTIRSDSVIIGGPSAGGAIAALTFATLQDLDIDESVSITGTINSGGLIGPVSGLRAKIDAASEEGISTILIPGGMTLRNEDNETIDIIDYGEDRGVRVVDIYTIEDAVFYTTGKDYREEVDFNIPDEYRETMKMVSGELCERTENLYNTMVDLTEWGNPDELEMANELTDVAINLTARAESVLDFDNYYSAASYCFGANIRYQNVILLQKDLDNSTVAEIIQNVETQIDAYEHGLENRSLETLSDLETYMIVKERILTAEDYVDNAKSSFYTDKYNSLYNLAYAIERLDSAQVWEHFFDIPGKQFDINDEFIRESCIQKLSEAQERYQYVQLFIPASLDEARRNIERAMNDYKQGNYDLCVSKASDAKATINVLLSVMGVSEGNVENLVERKLDSVRKVIAREQEKGIFPILGYSYYEYADSLKDSDVYSSLIYAEQALELSTLDIYFDESNGDNILRFFTFSPAIISVFTFGFGIVIGILLVMVLVSMTRKAKRSRRRKKIKHKM